MTYRGSEGSAAWDPLDYIAYSFHLIEEQTPDRYRELQQQRLRLSLRPAKEGSNYLWTIFCNGNRTVVEGATPVKKEAVDTLPVRINQFLKNRGFFVDEASGIIN